MFKDEKVENVFSCEFLAVCLLEKKIFFSSSIAFYIHKKKKEKTVLNHSNAIEELQYFSFNASCKYPVSIKSISLLVVCMLVCVWHVKPIVPIGMLKIYHAVLLAHSQWQNAKRIRSFSSSNVRVIALPQIALKHVRYQCEYEPLITL